MAQKFINCPSKATTLSDLWKDYSEKGVLFGRGYGKPEIALLRCLGLLNKMEKRGKRPGEQALLLFH